MKDNPLKHGNIGRKSTPNKHLRHDPQSPITGHMGQSNPQIKGLN